MDRLDFPSPGCYDPALIPQPHLDSTRLETATGFSVNQRVEFG
jgi:hypothetical protein